MEAHLFLYNNSPCVAFLLLVEFLLFLYYQRMDYLNEGIKKLGIQSGADNGAADGNAAVQNLYDGLNTYINELELFNSAYDLVGADTHDDIIIRHVLDSLSAVPFLSGIISEYSKKGIKPLIADIGSGGGLPGIPLSLAFRDQSVTLVERMSKRCSFLENCKAVLNLTNVTVENEQAERLAQKRFDIVVFRAFRPLDKKMIKVLMRIIKPEGYLCAYKAKKDKITEEMDGIKEFIPGYEIVPLQVPFLTDNNEYERNLVVVRKPVDL